MLHRLFVNSNEEGRIDDFLVKKTLDAHFVEYTVILAHRRFEKKNQDRRIIEVNTADSELVKKAISDLRDLIGYTAVEHQIIETQDIE